MAVGKHRGGNARSCQEHINNNATAAAATATARPMRVKGVGKVKAAQEAERRRQEK